MYNVLKVDADLNRNYNGNNWACYIKQVLNEHGFSFVWNLQSLGNVPFSVIVQRISDQYKQKWYSDINNSRRLNSYALFKHDFECEPYLDKIVEPKYRISLTKFRLSAYSLRIETGRHENLSRQDRICRNCNMNQVENEYHFLLVCPCYRNLRIKYFKPYFCHWPNIYKFQTLMETKSYKILINLAKYVYFANKIRKWC